MEIILILWKGYDADNKKVMSDVIGSNCIVPDNFMVYPNPVHNVATIKMNVSSSSTVVFKLYDSKGALVKTFNQKLSSGNNQISLNIESFAAGIYTLYAQWNGEVKQIKILKQ